MNEKYILGTYSEFVLRAIKSLTEEASVNNITLRLKEVGVIKKTSTGCVYSTIIRLKELGLVKQKIAVSRPMRGGRARAIYTMTLEGERALQVKEKVLAFLRMPD